MRTSTTLSPVAFQRRFTGLTEAVRGKIRTSILMRPSATRYAPWAVVHVEAKDAHTLLGGWTWAWSPEWRWI